MCNEQRPKLNLERANFGEIHCFVNVFSVFFAISVHKMTIVKKYSIYIIYKLSDINIIWLLFNIIDHLYITVCTHVHHYCTVLLFALFSGLNVQSVWTSNTVTLRDRYRVQMLIEISNCVKVLLSYSFYLWWLILYMIT